MNIKYHKKAVKFINSLPPKERQRIKRGIEKLIESPKSCDIKMFTGCLSNNTKQLISLFEILPESDQEMLLTLTKKLILAYDPDYTKLLPEEKKELEEAMADLKNDINISDGSDIQW